MEAPSKKNTRQKPSEYSEPPRVAVDGPPAYTASSSSFIAVAEALSKIGGQEVVVILLLLVIVLLLFPSQSPPNRAYGRY